MLELDEEDGKLAFTARSLLTVLTRTPTAAETSSSAIDTLLEATQAHQDAVQAKRKAEEEAKAPPKGTFYLEYPIIPGLPLTLCGTYQLRETRNRRKY